MSVFFHAVKYMSKLKFLTTFNEGASGQVQNFFSAPDGHVGTRVQSVMFCF